MWLPWWVASHLTEAIFPAGMLESWMNEGWFIPLRNRLWTMDRSMTAAEGRNRPLSLSLLPFPLPLSCLLSFAPGCLAVSVWPSPCRAVWHFLPHLSCRFRWSIQLHACQPHACACLHRDLNKDARLPETVMWCLSTKRHNQFQCMSYLFAQGTGFFFFQSGHLFCLSAVKICIQRCGPPGCPQMGEQQRGNGSLVSQVASWDNFAYSLAYLSLNVNYLILLFSSVWLPSLFGLCLFAWDREPIQNRPLPLTQWLLSVNKSIWEHIRSCMLTVN